MSDETPAGYREAIEALAAKPYARDLFGLVLDAVSPGSVTLRLEHRPELGHLPGWFQGAVTSALAEYAASWSTMTQVAPGWATLTLEQSIHFVGKAKGDRLIAIGRIVQSGASTSVGTAEVFAEDGGARTLCAVMILTNRHLPPR